MVRCRQFLDTVHTREPRPLHKRGAEALQRRGLSCGLDFYGAIAAVPYVPVYYVFSGGGAGERAEPDSLYAPVQFDVEPFLFHVKQRAGRGAVCFT